MTEQFRDAIRSTGLEPPDVIEADGKIHRFASNGKRGDDAGWYVLHRDGVPAGAFGCWRTGVTGTWRADIGRTFTAAEEAAHRATLEAIQRARDADKARRRSEARENAAVIWKAAQPAPDDHPYLVCKGVKAHGIRVHNGALVIPMRDGSGTTHSLQTIQPNGEKRFLTGGRVAGCYFAIGNPKNAQVLCIAEGFATGASIHRATGNPVAVAFSAGNLEAVARALRMKFPDLPLIVCADHDDKTPGNPGVTKATAAALAVGGMLAVPDFGMERPDGVTDFNDLAAHRGAAAVAQAIASATSVQSRSPGIVYRRLSDVQAKPIRWLWPGRMAGNKVTMVAGNPGLGKSQLTASLAAVVSAGGTWPVHGDRCQPGAVVILSAEDEAEDTIRPRLEAAGADLQRCFILDAVRDIDARGNPIRRAFSLQRDLDRLSNLIATLDSVRLVVIDPISAYLGDVDSHKNADIRALLAPLGELAAKHGVAMVAVSHFNKSGQQDALMRVMGSLAFVAAARAAFAVVKDQEDPTRRLFLPLKNNLGRDETGCAFKIESVTLPGGIETSRVVWEADAVTITVQEAMAPVLDTEERSEIEDAKEFLEALLADGPVTAKQVRADAEGAGHSWATIRRAQKTLGIGATKDGMKGPWVWKLPPKALKSSEDAHSESMSAFGENEHLRQNGDQWEDVG